MRAMFMVWAAGGAAVWAGYAFGPDVPAAAPGDVAVAAGPPRSRVVGSLRGGAPNVINNAINNAIDPPAHPDDAPWPRGMVIATPDVDRAIALSMVGPGADQSLARWLHLDLDTAILTAARAIP